MNIFRPQKAYFVYEKRSKATICTMGTLEVCKMLIASFLETDRKHKPDEEDNFVYDPEGYVIIYFYDGETKYYDKDGKEVNEAYTRADPY